MADQLANLLAQNPYYVSGANFAKTNFIPDDASSGEKLALLLAQGLGSGLLAGYGRSQVEQEVASDNQQLAQALAQPTFQGKIDALATNPRYQDLAQALIVEQVKGENELDLKTKLAKAEDEIKNPWRYGKDDAATDAVYTGASQDLFPGGPESLKSKFNKTFTSYQRQGATPNAAIEAATTMTAAERKAMTGSVDKVAEAREVGKKMLDLAATAEAGVSGAGNTGGSFYGARNAFSNLQATLGSSDEARTQSFRGQLDSIAPEIVKTFRSPGAVSDFESRMIIKAGPSTTNLPETNQALIDKMKVLGQLQIDYADFLDAYREEKGTTQGAEKLWQAYKKDHPIYAEQENGEVVINPNRPSWQEYFTGAAPTTGEQPRSVETPSTSVPAGPTREQALEELRRRGALR